MLNGKPETVPIGTNDQELPSRLNAELGRLEHGPAPCEKLAGVRTVRSQPWFMVAGFFFLRYPHTGKLVA